jgi:hypothetical protein
MALIRTVLPPTRRSLSRMPRPVLPTYTAAVVRRWQAGVDVVFVKKYWRIFWNTDGDVLRVAHALDTLAIADRQDDYFDPHLSVVQHPQLPCGGFRQIDDRALAEVAPVRAAIDDSYADRAAVLQIDDAYARAEGQRAMGGYHLPLIEDLSTGALTAVKEIGKVSRVAAEHSALRWSRVAGLTA